MKTDVRQLEAGIERLRRNRADYVLTIAIVARTALDCAAVTTHAANRSRNLHKASAIADRIAGCLENTQLEPSEIIAIGKVLATMRVQLAKLQWQRELHFGCDLMPIGSLPEREMRDRFSPRKSPLFAGDLYKTALRLRPRGAPPPRVRGSPLP